MTIPTTITAEYDRAKAAEKALSDRLAKLEPTPAPAPVVTVPGPQPTPAPTTEFFAPTDRLSYLISLLSDDAIAAVTLDGTYHVGSTKDWLLTGTRKTPLDIGPRAGGTWKITGPADGSDADGGIYFGTDSAALVGPYTFHDFWFDGLRLRQAAALEVRQVDGVVIRRVRETNPFVNRTYATVYKRFLAYISSKGTVGCRNYLLEDLSIESNGQSSGVQWDSFVANLGSGKLSRLVAHAPAGTDGFAVYADIPGGPTTISGVEATGYARSGHAVSLNRGTGTYTGIALSGGAGTISASSSWGKVA